MYEIIDTHCDALMKLEQHPTWSFAENDQMDITVAKLKAGHVKVQGFAIFIDPAIDSAKQYDVALGQIEAFKERVLCYPDMKQIRHFKEIDQLQAHEIGAFLTLEGLDCIGNSLDKLNHLLDEGVLSVGLTWNSVNLACDGIGEPRGGGLTAFGRDVVACLNDRNILIDTAHISYQGFWDVVEHGRFIWNSHCGVYEVNAHGRNLNHLQIQAIAEKKGTVHMVYLPFFLSGQMSATIEDVSRHIAQIAQWGLLDVVGLGSDFDGISEKVEALEDASQSQNLLNYLELNYNSEQVKAMASQNFKRFVALID